MTFFEGWTRLCDKNNTEIWPIYKATDRPECGLYMTKSKFWSGNNIFYDNPVYQVWINDDRECVTQVMNNAIAYWKRRTKEEGIKYTEKAETMRKLNF